jgi:hypothetical protein
MFINVTMMWEEQYLTQFKRYSLVYLSLMSLSIGPTKTGSSKRLFIPPKRKGWHSARTGQRYKVRNEVWGSSLVWGPILPKARAGKLMKSQNNCSSPLVKNFYKIGIFSEWKVPFYFKGKNSLRGSWLKLSLPRKFLKSSFSKQSTQEYTIPYNSLVLDQSWVKYLS